MAAIKLTGEVLGEQQLSRAFSRLVSLTDDFSPVLEKIGEDIRDIEREQFDAEGYGWQELSPAYQAWKELHYPGKGILRRTDRLYLAMTFRGAPDNVSIVGPKSASFGATEPSGLYGGFHQLGGGPLPRRKVIDLREQDKRQITDTFHAYLVRLGPESGFMLA